MTSARSRWQNSSTSTFRKSEKGHCEKEQKKKPDPTKSNVNQVLDFDGLEEIKADEIALDIDADGPPASVEVALQDSLPTAQ